MYRGQLTYCKDKSQTLLYNTFALAALTMDMNMDMDGMEWKSPV
jgi:hypothetical protein